MAVSHSPIFDACRRLVFQKVLLLINIALMRQNTGGERERAGARVYLLTSVD